MLETLCLTETLCGDVQGFSAAAIKRSFWMFRARFERGKIVVIPELDIGSNMDAFAPTRAAPFD